MADGVADSGDPSEFAVRRLLARIEQISQIGSWQWVVATGAVTWSDQLYRIYGVDPATPITLEYFLSRIHPDERARIQREIQTVLRHPGTFQYREVIVRSDGAHRTLDTIGETTCGADGTVVKLVGTCRDVTELVSRDQRIQFYSDVFEHVQIGLSGWQVDRSEATPKLRLLAFNTKTETLIGTPLGGRLGQSLIDLLPELEDSALLEEASAMSFARPIRKLPPFARSDAQGAPWLAATLFTLPGRQLGLALEDVTAQVRASMLQAAEREALEMLAGGAPLPAILEVIVRAIETSSPGTIASVLLLDSSGTKIKHGAAPGLPAKYSQALDGLDIGPRAGSCGTAMYRRERVIVNDITTDPLWESYRAMVAPFGLRACWSEPILATDGRVLGAFALYHREPRSPDAAAYELLARAAHVTGIAIERRMLDDQLRALAGKIESVREEERTTIARDIHDQLGQALTAHKLDVGWLLRRITEPALVAKLEELARSTDEVIRSVQRIATELRPGVLDHLGLRAAIEWQAEEFERRAGLICRVTSSLSNLVLERELTTGVFRIFQEALTNVARHANAKVVEVSLHLQHGQLHLEISDDGVGFPEVGLGPQLGILGMRERAVRLGGECIVQRKQPTGVQVSVVLPLRFPPELHAIRD